MKQKEKASTVSKISSSNDRKSNKSSNSSHVADYTHAELTKQSVDDLETGLGHMCINKNASLSMQEMTTTQSGSWKLGIMRIKTNA